MDFQSMTLAGLVAVGVVNVLTMWKPSMDSKLRFAISALAAFVVTFVPPDMGNMILEKAKDALMVAFAASGAYKIAQKTGGN